MNQTFRPTPLAGRYSGRRTYSVPVGRAGAGSDAVNQSALLDGALIKRPGALLALLRPQSEIESRKPEREELRDILQAVSAASPSGNSGPAFGMTPAGPRKLHLWWKPSVLPKTGDLFKAISSPQSFLRFYDVTGMDPECGKWHHTFDIEVDIEKKFHTLDLWTAGRTYVAELGLRFGDGRFLRLARANTISLPREGRAEASPVRLCVVESNREKPLAPAVVEESTNEVWDWTEEGGDWPERDLMAETAIRRLYRRFLVEGPKALRDARIPGMRSAEELASEFEKRRARRAAGMSGSMIFMARVDAVGESKARVTPAHPLQRMRAVRSASVAEQVDVELFSVLRDFLELAKRWQPPQPTVQTPQALAKSVGAVEADIDLHERLSRLSRALELARATAEAAKVVAGVQARDGVAAVDRVALVLRGRTAPNAKLDVAGRLVRADARGYFRVECVLSGRRMALPVRHLPG